MTLDLHSRPDLLTQPESRPADGVAPSWPDTQGRNGDANPSAEPHRPVLPNEASARRGGGQVSRAAPSSTAAAKTSARHCGPEDHSTNASAGSALSTTGTLPASGAPTHSEPAIEVPKPHQGLPARRGGRTGADLQDTSAPAPSTDPATEAAKPKRSPRGRGRVHSSADTPSSADATLLSGPASEATEPGSRLRDRGDGQRSSADLTSSAVAQPSAPDKDALKPRSRPPERGDGPSGTDIHRADAVATNIATVVDLWRQRQRLRGAVGGLNLTALAVCRRALDGDKEAAQKAWAAIQKGKGDATLAMVLLPYRQMMEVGEKHATALEKQLAKIVRPLPLWAWAKDVRGLGELTVAGLIGEAAGNPGDYRSVSALWKRFGLAVIDGGRQRRVSDAEAALIHGYAPQRRAFAYVVSTQLMRSQRAEDPYRQLYDRRKAYELAREIPKAHAHNRALRVMVKELFKQAWLADRRGRGVFIPEPQA